MIYKSDGTVIAINKGKQLCQKNNQGIPSKAQAEAEKDLTVVDQKDQLTRSALLL